MASENDDVLKILLATDCHLGYLENDGVRGSDSMTTFEEILKIAVEKEVDFILLGGDLFHENKPSRKTLHDCISLMRKYCMGDRPVQFEFLSDQSDNFKHSSFPVVNFEDPNLNISVPIFSIHGNHDDPAGAGCYCSLDLLSATGLVNYFGKCTDLQNINISPLMLQKGKTKLCLYGLGSIRDERLHRLFLEGKVTMLRPKENCDDWFNLMVVHQNRAKHGAKNYLPEQFLDNFIDLVLWGHEHECRIDKEWNEQQAFYVTQPGSSVATSLCHGEAVPKHVGLLQIRQKEFQITKIPLQTVRQFYIKDIDLEETSLNLNEPDSCEKVIDYCNEIVEQFLEKAENEHTGHPKQPKLPLIRLRVFCPPKFDVFSVQRFGHSYVSKVANTKDIILFSRRKEEKSKGTHVDEETLRNVLKQEGFDKQRVEDMVIKYFEAADDSMRLQVLSEIGVGRAIQEYVMKDVKEAIGLLIEHQVCKTQKHLKTAPVDQETIDDAILKFRDERRRNIKQEANDVQESLRNRSQMPSRGHSSDLEDDDDPFDETRESVAPRGRGRGRGRGSRGGRGGRGSTRANDSVSSTSSARSSTRAVAKRNPSDSAASKRKGKQSDLSSFLTTSRSVQDVIDLSDDDDDEVQQQPKRRKVTAPRSRKGIVFEFSD